MQQFVWYNSIRFRLGLAVFALFVLQAGTAGITLYEVDLRKHDYTILVLAGQLRVISNEMQQQSINYLAGNNTDTSNYQRDLQQYYQTLQQQIQLYDKIIKAYSERKLPPDLTGRDDPLTCSWDKQSKDQLDISAVAWLQFKQQLTQSFGPSPEKPDIIAGARYIADHSRTIIASSDRLNRAFQAMMEEKLALIHLTNKIALFVSAILTILVAVGVYRKITHPLKQTVNGFERVANGDLGYQIPVRVENEIGRMTVSFNQLSSRLRSLFNLTDRINQGTNLYDTLQFVCTEFRTFLPVEWVGVLTLNPERSRYLLERLYTDQAGTLKESDSFATDLGLPDNALIDGTPFAVSNLADVAKDDEPNSFVSRLLLDKKQSAVLLPLSNTRGSEALLVFSSSHSNAYSENHLEFLGNLAAQISHILEKTLVMEGLVVAAVEGLAKLAESRDPETGDHLVRMSLYAALLCEELAVCGPYTEEITPAYTREVFRFAPMHDIGKVGVRDDVLLKPARLDPDERIEMERHPLIGAQVLRRCEDQMNSLGHSIFRVGIEIAECHHEKYDGSGYPQGLKGSAIPLSARIIAVSDVFDALTSKRPYKDAWPVEKALATIRQDAGSHFDPDIIKAFDRILPRVMDIYDRYKHT